MHGENKENTRMHWKRKKIQKWTKSFKHED